MTVPQPSGPGSDRKDTGGEKNRHPDATLSSSGNQRKKLEATLRG